MSERSLIIPLCRLGASGSCSYASATGPRKPEHEWDEETRTLEIRLPDPKKVEAGILEIRLRKLTAGDPYTCGKMETCLLMERDPMFDNPLAEKPEIVRMDDYARLRLMIHGHCAWRNIVASAHFPALAAPPVPVASSEGSRPPSDACEEYAGEVRHDIVDNSVLAPGMQINARQTFRDGPLTTTDVCGWLWYHTCSMTGGVVRAVEGDHDTMAVRYTVEAENLVLAGVRPSDFVPYVPGDIVFIIQHSGDPCAMDCDLGPGLLPDPPTPPADAPEDWTPEPADGSGWMIVPFYIGAFRAAAARPHERIRHDLDVRETTDLCVLTAMIIHVHPGEDCADIMLPPAHGGDRVDRVPIHYHCQRSMTVRGGWSAFQDDMVVVVIKRWHRQGSRAGYVIVSPADGLTECRKSVMFMAGADYAEAIEVEVDPKPELREEPWAFAAGDSVSVEGGSATVSALGSQAGKRAIVHQWETTPENVLVGDFSPAFWESERRIFGPNAIGRIKAAWRYHYATPRALVPPRVVFSGFSLDEYEGEWSIPHPFDAQEPGADNSAGGDTAPPVATTWAKTHGDVTVVAARWRPVGELLPRWGIAATYMGEPILFPGGQRMFGDIPAGSFAGMPPAVVMHHLGFDVWMTGETYRISMSAQGADFATFVWTLDPATLMLTLESDERPGAGLVAHEQWSIEWVRLVGLDRETPYYCRFNRSFYWRGNGGEVVDFPGWAIRAIMWDPVRRIPEVWRKSAPEQRAVRRAYVLGIGKSNYYPPPYACAVYADGYSGYNCRNLTFNPGGPASVDVTHGGETVTLGYGSGVIHGGSGMAIGYIRTHYHWFSTSSGLETDYEDHVVGSAKTVDGGTKFRFSGGRTNLDIHGSGSPQWGIGFVEGRFCTAEDVMAIDDVQWIFDPAATPAGTHIQREMTGDIPDESSDAGPNDTTCEWGEWEEIAFGRDAIVECASGWPYDRWKAILLGGRDCRGGSLTPAVVYSNGVVVTATGHVIEGDAAAGRRQVFFSTRLVPEDC